MKNSLLLSQLTVQYTVKYPRAVSDGEGEERERERLASRAS